MCGLFSNCGEWGLLSSWDAEASHCRGLFCCRALALGHEGSAVVALGLCRIQA